MVRLLSIRDARFAAIPPAIERAMAHLGDFSTSTVTLAHVLPVRTADIEDLRTPDFEIADAHGGEARLHIQILLDDRPALYARFKSDGDEGAWVFTEITRSDHANALAEAIARLEGDDTMADADVAVLDIPSHYFRGFILRSPTELQVLPVIAPAEVELAPTQPVSIARLHAALADSGIGRERIR